MSRPRIADLFCGAGGSAMGLSRAGFEIVGFDIAPQKHYPFEFHQQDALTVDLRGFDAVWSSPPCQGYSVLRNLPWLKEREYPLLILPTIRLLEHTGKPYVLENVMNVQHGAKGLAKRGLEAHGLQAGWLCGRMFNRPFCRHRLFATNWLWLAPEHPKHTITKMSVSDRDSHHMGGHLNNGRNWGYGHQTIPGGVKTLQEAMGIDWMTRDEMTQAIPPVYSEFLGRQLMAVIEERPDEQKTPTA